jgi:hypothetical protein
MQLIPPMQLHELPVGEIDQVVERQALRKLAITRAVGGSDQAAQALPQVVLLALRADPLEQRLLLAALSLVVHECVSNFALSLAQAFELDHRFVE